MTRTVLLDVGVVVSSFIAGGLINWLVKPDRLRRTTLLLLVLVTVGAVVVLTVVKDSSVTQSPDDGRNIVAVKCPRVFDNAHDLLTKQSSTDAPPPAGFAFSPSQDLPGRVDLSLTWINPVPIAQSAAAVQGVYGQADPADDFIDHSEPAAGTGNCWNWYHFGTRDDAQPTTVRLRVSGLWPKQRYCFFTVYRTDVGYSKPTSVRCETAPWDSQWGVPAQAPSK